MSTHQGMHNIKLVVVGGPSSGKTSITTRFVDGTFYENIQLEDNHCFWKQIQLENERFTVEIFDAPCRTTDLDDIREQYFRTCHGFVLVFSLTDPSSLHQLQNIKEEIIRLRGSLDVPAIVVGNKCDLQERNLESESVVRKLFKKFGYLETSARFGVHINEIFYDVVRQVSRQFPQKPEPSKKCLIM